MKAERTTRKSAANAIATNIIMTVIVRDRQSKAIKKTRKCASDVIKKQSEMNVRLKELCQMQVNLMTNKIHGQNTNGS